MRCSHLPLLLLYPMVALFPTFITATTAIGAAEACLHPLVVIPGSGGNQLEAHLTAEYKPSSLFCKLWGRGETASSKWFRIWFDPTVLLPPITKCFAERMTLYYHRDIDDYRNAPGVETRVPYFGSTEGLLYLDPNLKHITEYMATLVGTLEKMGYRDGQNLFGAPYDFRYGLASEGHPCQVGTEYLANLKSLVENASEANDGKPVILLSHSLGGLFALNLLNRNPLPWRQKYVKHLLTLSAPWGGTVEEMLTFASGYSLGIPLVDPLLVREEQRSSESNMWLLPAPKVFEERPLVITQKRNYTASDMSAFLEDIGFPEGVYPYETRTLPMVAGGVPAPGVPVTCIVGSEVKTAETLYYNGGDDGFDEQPEVVYGDGDGTVNMASLTAVEREWSGVTEQGVKVTRLAGVSHTDILKDGAALKEIQKEIGGINADISRFASLHSSV